MEQVDNEICLILAVESSFFDKYSVNYAAALISPLFAALDNLQIRLYHNIDAIYWAEVLGHAFTTNEEYSCLKRNILRMFIM